MASRGCALPAALVRQLRQMHARGWSLRGLARAYRLSRNTVRKYTRRPPPRRAA